MHPGDQNIYGKIVYADMPKPAPDRVARGAEAWGDALDDAIVNFMLDTRRVRHDRAKRTPFSALMKISNRRK
jgi:hypothetical protein